MDGKRLRSLREAHGLPQWKVAVAAGIEPGRMSKLERGWFPIKPEVAARIESAIKRLAEEERGDE